MPTRKKKVKKKLQKIITAKFRRARGKGNGKSNQNTKNWLKDPKTYKTKLCENFSKYGNCPYKGKCLFAHGSEQLRHNPSLSQSSSARPVMPPLQPGLPPSLSTNQYFVMPPLPTGPPPPLSTSQCPGMPVSRRRRVPPSLPPSITTVSQPFYHTLPRNYDVPCDIGSLQLSPPNSPKLLKFTNSPPSVHRPEPINITNSRLAKYYLMPNRI